MYAIIKRLFDVLSSALAIVIVSPLWLIIIIGIKLSSPGPVFYKSVRSSIGHRPFSMYKFRSMHVYRPDAAGNAGKGEGGFIANENRIFKFGGFLRKSKLDELPQLLNVLLGQMSVIGPRPYPEETVQKYYSGEYECVMAVKSGLSCLDSLFDYAHGELFVKDEKEYARTVLPIRTELARMYVEKQSIGLDAYCIFRTIQLMFEIVVLKKREFEYTGFEKQAKEALSGKTV